MEEFSTGERRAEAVVHTVAEGQVRTTIGAIQAELGSIAEHRLVPVG